MISGKYRTLTISIAIGTLLLGCFFFLNTFFPKLHPLSQVNFQLTRQEIVQIATQYLPLDAPVDSLDRQADFVIREESTYLQRLISPDKFNKSLLKYYRYWQVLFLSKERGISNIVVNGRNSSGNRNLRSSLYEVRLSADGQLILFDFSKPVLKALRDSLPARRPPERPSAPPTGRFPGMRAQKQALDFLVDFVRDTSDLELVSRSAESDSSVRYFKFTFKEIRNGISSFYTVRHAAGKIFYYQVSLQNGKFDKRLTKFEKFSEIALPASQVVVSIFLIVSFLIFLLRLLRQESISFKLAFPLTISIFVIQFFVSVSELSKSSYLLALGGSLLYSLFVAVGILFLYAVSDAFARGEWSQKLAVTDLFQQSKFFRPSTSKAALRGLLLGIVSLTVYGLMLYAYRYLIHGEIFIKEDLHYSTTTLFPTLIIALIVAKSAVFHEYFFRLFGLTLLKRWLKKNIWIVTIGSLIGIYFTSDLKILNFPVSIFILLPSAIIFVYFFLRYEIMTTLVGYFCFVILSKAIVYGHSSEKYFHEIGVGLHLILGLLLVLSLIALLVKKKEGDDGEIYIPEYVERQTEKNRLLRELDLARSIQLQFLPKTTPVIPGYQISANCQPAWEVGGDYYDFFSLNGDKLGIVIGDVSNKGISAAFFMTLVKGFLKALSLQYQNPADILRHTNKLFYQNVERGHFVSMIYGVLDPATHCFTFARAGHNPLLIVIGKTDRSEWKTPPGVGIGIVNDEKFAPLIADETIALEAGDLIVLYTDGYTEAMNSKLEEFGEENLQQFVKENQSLGTKELIGRLDVVVGKWEGKQRASDDKTIVVIKRQ